MMAATWSYREGKWLVRVHAPDPLKNPPRAGDTVQVSRADGTRHFVQLGPVVHTDGHVFLHLPGARRVRKPAARTCPICKLAGCGGVTGGHCDYN